jgi:hypothetical protein
MSSGKVLQLTGEDIMQRRGQKTTFQERIVVSELAEGGHTDQRLQPIWTAQSGRSANGDAALSTRDAMV